MNHQQQQTRQSSPENVSIQEQHSLSLSLSSATDSPQSSSNHETNPSNDSSSSSSSSSSSAPSSSSSISREILKIETDGNLKKDKVQGIKEQQKKEVVNIGFNIAGSTVVHESTMEQFRERQGISSVQMNPASVQSSFHEFFEEQETYYDEQMMDHMSDAERQRQLDQLLREEDSEGDVDYGGEKDKEEKVATKDDGLPSQLLGSSSFSGSGSASASASASVSSESSSTSESLLSNHEDSMLHYTNDNDVEPDKILPTSSTTTTTATTTTTKKVSPPIQLTITTSKSAEQTSEFDRAMTNVIHSGNTAVAHRKVSYSASSHQEKQDLHNIIRIASPPPPDSSPSSSASSFSTSTPSNTLSYPQTAIPSTHHQGDASQTTISESVSTIQQVRTLDEDDGGVETALEMSLFRSIKSPSSSNDDDNDDADDNGDDNHGQELLSKTSFPNEKVSIDEQQVHSPSVESTTDIAKNDNTAMPSLSSPLDVGMKAVSTTSLSLAQQIKQSIDGTPSKPLPKTIRPQPPEPPTMRPSRTYVTDQHLQTTIRPKLNDQTSRSLPNVIGSMRDKIDSLFETERRDKASWKDEDEQTRQKRDDLRKIFQQSVNAAVLVSLAHKRYERRRLAAMEIEKVVRDLVYKRDLERVKGILLLLSDDYVRSTNEDARKGGVVAMAACAIGLKRAHDMPGLEDGTNECTDLILGSVVHACQDNSQRVRYYATESLFNVIKVLNTLALEHFFILFEILSSLSADVDVDVRSGAELLDKKLQSTIVGSINAGQFNADACIPLFLRFLQIQNKQTKRLTLSWLQAFADQLIGAPLLEFLHLFLYDVFSMLADPSSNIHQPALTFLNSMLPKLWNKNEDFEDSAAQNKVDFDKILQALVTAMEHPDPFVRKVAMYWVYRIVDEHMGGNKALENTAEGGAIAVNKTSHSTINAASVSVRNALEHVLPGLLLSIGDTFKTRGAGKDLFFPDQSTHYLADLTNRCIQKRVREEGTLYVSHLSGFVVALREELETPGGLSRKNRYAKERKPYRMDVKPDGSGIESTGWFHNKDEDDDQARIHENILSRLCALDWVVLLFQYVVPNTLKDEYANEFIKPIIRLLDDAPEVITLKSLEVLSKITITKNSRFEMTPSLSATSTKNMIFQNTSKDLVDDDTNNLQTHPMTDANATYALGILAAEEKCRLSRNREVFAALIESHAKQPLSLPSLPRIVKHMCALQPPEFVFISFGLELDAFVMNTISHRAEIVASEYKDYSKIRHEDLRVSKNLQFASKLAQVLSNVFLTCKETERLRNLVKGSIGHRGNTTRDERKAQTFHILLKTFAHHPVAAISFCLWCGAFRTAATYIHKIDTLDLDLSFFMDLDQLIEFIERPLFRDLRLSMLDCDENPALEGSGAMLYRVLKSILMLLPQSTAYRILQQRLLSVARFRQCAVYLQGMPNVEIKGTNTEIFVHRILEVRRLHCDAKWRSIRSESLEVSSMLSYETVDADAGRRSWLGYSSQQDEIEGRGKIRENFKITKNSESSSNNYQGLHKAGQLSPDEKDETDMDLVRDEISTREASEDTDDLQWKEVWAEGNHDV